MTKVLVVEDSLETQILLKSVLSPLYDLKMVTDLQSAWSQIEKEDFEILLLDRSLPDGDGVSLLEKLKSNRRRQQPFVLMLTALSDIEDKVQGLSSGADDYIVKPFEPRELLARMDAFLRRKANNPAATILNFENLSINTETHSVSIKSNGESRNLDLTPIEYKVLVTLVKNDGREIERDLLVQTVWDKINLSVRNIDTHICHLRKKIDGSNVQIKNRRGKGYYVKRSDRTPFSLNPLLSNGLKYIEENQNGQH